MRASINLRDLTFFTLSLFCIGLNYWQYKQLGRKNSLVLMILMIVCCVWDIVEAVIE